MRVTRKIYLPSEPSVPHDPSHSWTSCMMSSETRHCDR